MSPVLIISLVFLFVILLGGGGFLFFVLSDNKKRMTDNHGPAANPSTTQAFLPFKDIADSMIIMDNYEYRMIVECNSINYFLKTEDEQDAVEASFRRMLNSIKFPFTIYVQTREIDNREMINNLRKDVDQTLKAFPQLREYSNIYVKELQGINAKLRSTKFKKKYIVVTYDEAGKMTNLNDNEKREYAFEELYNRCKLVISGLSNIGIKAKILDSSEVANVVYQSMHKEVGSVPDDIMNGGYMEMTVKGKKYTQPRPDAMIDSIMLEFENKLSTNVIKDSLIDDAYKEKAARILSEVDRLRKNAKAEANGQKGGNPNEK